MRLRDCPYSRQDDPAGGQQQHRGNDCSRKGLRFAVAVGMILVGRFGGQHQSAPDDNGADDVRQGLDGIGDERMGMANDAGGELGARQKGIDRQAHEGGAQTALEPVHWPGPIRWQNMASRSLGSNQVLLGGMMPPASAMAMRSSMLVGNSEKAQAYSPALTSFSSSAVPRMPPTKLMRLLVRGSAMPKTGSSTCLCRSVTSSVSIASVAAVKRGRKCSVCHWPPR